MSCSADGPRSIKEFNSKITAFAESGNSGELKTSGDLNEDSYNETDDPLHIHGDAGDLLPQSNAEYLVLEIVESSKHSVGLVARAMSQPMGTTTEQSSAQKDRQEEGKDFQEKQSSHQDAETASADEEVPDTSKRKAESAANSDAPILPQEDTVMTKEQRDADDVQDEEDEDTDGPIFVSMEEAEEEAKATKKIWNATSRRRGAFRRGLVRCVMVMHEAFLKRLGADYQDYDPLKEGQWHADFPVASLSMAEVLKAAEDASEQLASAEQSGRVK